MRNNISPTTAATISTPTQTPALKMPPATAQPGKKKRRFSNRDAHNNVNDLFICAIYAVKYMYIS